MTIWFIKFISEMVYYLLYDEPMFITAYTFIVLLIEVQNKKYCSFCKSLRVGKCYMCHVTKQRYVHGDQEWWVHMYWVGIVRKEKQLIFIITVKN